MPTPPLSHNTTDEPETTGASAGPLILVETSPGVYGFAASGTKAGSLVSDGAGGYVITVGTLTGTGRAVGIGAGIVIY